MLGCWEIRNAGMLECWDAGIIKICWDAGILRNAGMLECWDAGILRNAGMLECWNAGI